MWRNIQPGMRRGINSLHIPGYLISPLTGLPIITIHELWYSSCLLSLNISINYNIKISSKPCTKLFRGMKQFRSSTNNSDGIFSVSFSVRAPFNLRSSSVRAPFGLRSFSVRAPFNLRSSSVRAPFVLRSSSVRAPFVLRSSSVHPPFNLRSSSVQPSFKLRSTSVQPPFGLRSSSVQPPFGNRRMNEEQRDM